MFVGETGVARVVQKTCQAMRDAGIEDPYDVARIRALGGLPARGPRYAVESDCQDCEQRQQGRTPRAIDGTDT